MSPGPCREVEGLIPWYANGTLEAADRERVVRHVRSCPGCLGLLDQAIDQARLSLHRSEESCTAVVHPRLLTEYAEDPHRLDDATRRFVEERLERSPLSRDAIDRLRETVEAERRSPPGPAAERRTPWSILAGTLLRPAPALAYLLLLAALGPTLWLAARDGSQPTAPPVVTVGSERRLRDEGAPPPAPLVVVRGDRGVMLELVTELSASDLARLRAGFVAELRRDGELVWSTPLPDDRFRPREDGSVVTIHLPRGPLDDGTPYRILVRAVRPGDPIDGQPLFQRTLTFIDPDGG